MGSGFPLAAPILPGSHDISFSYEFTYDGTDLAYKHGLLQGAGLFQILIPQSLSDIQVGVSRHRHTPEYLERILPYLGDCKFESRPKSNRDLIQLAQT
ncbi:MAG: hypothetical protein CM1200mP35_04720 [Chloroflexota bacterium]|nr:MAG: hypothetical protein CM1200mP35_04720 [Chloroflexota bacterium]